MGDLSKNFSKSEFRCKCGNCDQVGPHPDLIEEMQKLRDELDAPITINSGHRCADYNKRVGGAKNSEHIKGAANDFTVKGMTPDQVQDHLLAKYPGRFGIGRYNTFTHFDVRDRASRWDERK